MKEESIWQVLKNSWLIKKKDIKSYGIDPDKDWEEITLRELDLIADHLCVTTSELIDYSTYT